MSRPRSGRVVVLARLDGDAVFDRGEVYCDAPREPDGSTSPRIAIVSDYTGEILEYLADHVRPEVTP